MSGEITVQERSLKAELVTLILAGAAASALTLVLFRVARVGGAVAGIAGALSAYVAYRILYGALNPSTSRRIAWALTDAELLLDGNTIPRASIRGVYCWPNRDALGHTRPGRVVNIETGRRNTLLRSSDAQALETLVHALGGQIPLP